jgi:hypothetical protein
MFNFAGSDITESEIAQSDIRQSQITESDIIESGDYSRASGSVYCLLFPNRSRMGCRRAVCLSILIGAIFALCPAGPARADVRVSVDVGWGDTIRLGRWTPVYVTLSDPDAKNVTLEIMAPHDSQASMRIRQRVVAGPTPTTYFLLAPFRQYSDATLAVLDDRGRHLADQTIVDNNDSTIAGGNQKFFTESAGAAFAGVGGGAADARVLEDQLHNANITAGYLTADRLPPVAMGYQALDVLMLNNPDFSAISSDQQQAIVDWVKSGGQLVAWAGDAPLPAGNNPLADALPAVFGDAHATVLPADVLSAAGLPDSMARISGRLLSPRPGAIAFAPPGWDDACTGYTWRLGLGRVEILPIDVAGLSFADSGKALAFWRGVLKPELQLSDPSASSTSSGYAYSGGSSQLRQTAAMYADMEILGNVPGLGRVDFTSVAMVLIGLMVVVGPVDYFVLKALGRQPLTWFTTAGWIGLVTAIAISTGYWLKNGDLYYRTLRVIDEADGACVGASDMLCIYSPRSTNYPLSVDPRGWWEPATPETGYYGGSQTTNDIGFEEKQNGTAPDPISVNIWSLQFLLGSDPGAGGPSEAPIDAPIDAELRVVRGADGDRLRGTIANRGARPLQHVMIRGADWLCSSADIPAGQTSAVDLPIAPNSDQAFRSRDGPQSFTYTPYGPIPAPAPDLPPALASYVVGAGLDPTRSQAIERLLTGNPRGSNAPSDADTGYFKTPPGGKASVACVYATIADPAPLDRLLMPGAIETHYQIIRAITSLRDSPETP